jgi:hypothetical protein
MFLLAEMIVRESRVAVNRRHERSLDAALLLTNPTGVGGHRWRIPLPTATDQRTDGI